MRYGIRYVVVAVGAPDDQATQEDAEAILEIMTKTSPLKCTLLSEDVSDRLTSSLLLERSGIRL